jgi:DNA-binding response OmpR family regulator
MGGTNAYPIDVTPAHVLVADDDPALRMLLAEVLEDEGLRVTTACNGDEVLDAVRSECPPPNLVLLDVCMPQLEPVTFARDWCAVAGSGKVPLVVITGLSEVPAPLSMLSDVAPVRKPFDLDALLLVVAQQVHQPGGAALARAQVRSTAISPPSRRA